MERRRQEVRKLRWSTGEEYTTEEWINYLSGIIEKYPVVSVEDPIGRKRMGRLENYH